MNTGLISVPFVSGSKLLVKKGMTGATGNIYTGLHEFEDMSFLLHFLKEDDLFVDIGANVGSYTVLASKVKSARTISIEPIPATFDHLLNNIKTNQIENLVSAVNIGLGEEESILKFTCDLDTVNHVTLNGEENCVEVEIRTLDSLIQHGDPILIKMDVEGFEKKVIQGGSVVLSNHNLKALLIELNGSGSRYGIDDISVHEDITNFGFKPFKYLPFERKLIELDTFGSANTLYLRDFEFVTNRLRAAENISVNGHSF